MNNHPLFQFSIFIYPVCLKQIQSGVLSCLPNWTDWMATQLSRCFSFLFFFQFANWISGRELTGLSQGDDEALTFLRCQNIRPPGKMTMGILRTGTPTPSSEGQQALGGARPWGCRGQAARKNTPGPTPGLRHTLPL